MTQKVTIIIGDKMDKKIRSIHTKAIQSTPNSVTLSSVVNEILRNGLKKETV